MLGSALLVACAAFAGDIATPSNFVPEGTPMVGTGIEVLDDNGMPTGAEWMVVDEDTVLPPEAPTVAPDKVASGDKNAIASLFGTIGGFLPTPLAPFAPIAGLMLAKLLGKRNRQNWGKALSNATHGDFKGAVRMAAAAEGILHTTEDPDELMAVAVNKRKMSTAASATPAA